VPAGLESLHRPGLPDGPSWIATALVSGLVLADTWSLWPAGSLEARLVRDAVLFLVCPIAIVLLARQPALRERLGWRIDREAVRTAVGLTAFVLPIYVVGASLPSIRAGYPMGQTAATATQFIPHAALVLGLVVATETFYRGLLCVGIRRVGPVAILVSPVVYTLQHLGGVPIEVLLAAPADVLFGAADYRSRSIVPSIVAHATGILVLEWLTLHPPLLPPEQVADALQWLPIPV
jgi:membrane protease YdiL (CAAX protease family)